MNNLARYVVCPTTCYRYNGVDSYIYRYFDGKSWESSFLTHALSWKILTYFYSPITQTSAIELIHSETNFTKEDIAEAVEALVECDIIIDYEDERFRTSLFYKTADFDDDSFYYPTCYHLHTANIKKIDYGNAKDAKENDFDAMKDYVRDEPIPSNYHKSLRSTPAYCLSEDVPINTFKFNAIGATAFAHDYPLISQDFSLDLLNFIINLTYAQIGSIDMISTGSHITKPVPSGGARHPTETYVVVVGLDSIEPGVYHYNVKNHRLDLIDVPQRQYEKLAKSISILPNSRDKRLLVGFIHTCRFSRSMFRYREPRSYRVMNFDLGHIHSNLSILSRLLGLVFASSYSLPESIVESILSLDPLQESVMSCFGIYEGSRDA